MATNMLNHLLSHSLATNEQIGSSLNFVLSALETQRLIERTEQEEGTGGPTLHRWQLRVLSLLSASNPASVRACGFQLVHHTLMSSPTLYLAASKQALTSGQQVLAAPVHKLDLPLFLSALETTKLIIAKSTWYPEWARENVGAQAVQKFVSTLVQAVNESPASQVKLASLATACTLIPLFPTALRPLSPALHTLSLSLLCDPTSTPALRESASLLFVSLYLLAPKGKEGLREAWKTGVEALIGSCDELAAIVSRGIFAEDDMTNHTLSPLALPPLADIESPFPALARLETLAKVLLLTLRTPATEKAGQVSIPIGALVELGTRLVAMNREMPVKERTDPTIHTLVISLVPRLQIVGCQILAQLGLCVGTQLVGFSNMVLGTVARTLSTYEIRSPMRPALSTTYSLLVSSLSAHIDPNEASKSLSRVWRTVLEDISSVALEPVNAAITEKTAPGQGGKKPQEGRKNKRVKTSFDPTESMVEKRAAVDERDLEIAIKGLETLERLLRAPISQFLPAALQLSTSRLLLYISLSPTFQTISSASSSQTPTFYPSSSSTSNRPLEIAKQSVPFRIAVLKALSTSVEFEIGGLGLEERSLQVWEACVNSTHDEVRLIGLQGLNRLGRVCHPRYPVALESENLERLRNEKRGGQVGNDEWELQQGMDEFRRKDEPIQEYRQDESDDESQDEQEEVEHRSRTEENSVHKKKIKPTKPEPIAAAGFSAAAFAPPSATASNGSGGGFSSFQAPAFGSKPVEASSAFTSSSFSTLAVPVTAPVDQQEVPSAAPVLSFSTETVTSKPTAQVTTTKTVQASGVDGKDSDDDSDDEMMPAIDMGSDQE
ncbi:uncharacterized protein JCM15063_005765 [Sporobolomyces koalae]|uniref:uncharacterized protein n=1 Tax=Sporobolomyces koalae TaxID=500713 RepID=UPI00317E06C9